MISTSNVGNVDSVGLPPLPRLNPRQIALLVLPGLSVNVMDATDEQFQDAIAQKAGIAPDDLGWSFDDRCRLINHLRKAGRDVFAAPNEKSSASNSKQFQTIQDNSERVPDGELFAVPEPAQQAHPDEGTPILDGWAAIIKAILTEPENNSETGAKGE